MTPNPNILQSIFEEELKTLNLDDIGIVFLNPPPDDYNYYESLAQWWMDFNDYSTRAQKQQDASFFVQFNPLSCKTPTKFRSAARHELYHIYRDGHRDRIGFFRRLFISGPAAILYQYFNIKI